MSCLFFYRDAFRTEMRCLPMTPTATQKRHILEMRRRLGNRISKFNQSAHLFTAGLELDVSAPSQDNPDFCIEENGEEMEDENESEFWNGVEESEDSIDEDDLADQFPENLPLSMPSSLKASLLSNSSLGDLAKKEAQLRVGQANDCLEQLRISIGHKSVLYRVNIRSSASVWTDTRSKQDIQRITLKINQNLRSYDRARLALISLKAPPDILAQYAEIKSSELGVSKDITEENRFGQSSDLLPWFWQVGPKTSNSNSWTDESMSINCLLILD